MKLGLLIGLVLLAIVSKSSFGATVQDNYQFANAQQRETFQTLISQLRCPMCQNQNIADSDAMIARDMRRKVYQLLQNGQSEDEVIADMKARYGDFIYYQPPLTVATIWLWLLPVLFAGTGFWVLYRRRKPAPVEDMAQRLAQAEKLLKQDKP